MIHLTHLSAMRTKPRGCPTGISEREKLCWIEAWALPAMLFLNELPTQKITPRTQVCLSLFPPFSSKDLTVSGNRNIPSSTSITIDYVLIWNENMQEGERTSEEWYELSPYLDPMIRELTGPLNLILTRGFSKREGKVKGDGCVTSHLSTERRKWIEQNSWKGPSKITMPNCLNTLTKS